MLEDDFYTVNNYLCKTDMPLRVLDAWNRIKKMRKELAQQTTNSAMVPLLRECREQLCKLQGHAGLTSRIDSALVQQHQ